MPPPRRWCAAAAARRAGAARGGRGAAAVAGRGAACGVARCRAAPPLLHGPLRAGCAARPAAAAAAGCNRRTLPASGARVLATVALARAAIPRAMGARCCMISGGPPITADTTPNPGLPGRAETPRVAGGLAKPGLRLAARTRRLARLRVVTAPRLCQWGVRGGAGRRVCSRGARVDIASTAAAPAPAHPRARALPPRTAGCVGSRGGRAPGRGPLPLPRRAAGARRVSGPWHRPCARARPPRAATLGAVRPATRSWAALPVQRARHGGRARAPRRRQSVSAAMAACWGVAGAHARAMQWQAVCHAQPNPPQLPGAARGCPRPLACRRRGRGRARAVRSRPAPRARPSARAEPAAGRASCTAAAAARQPSVASRMRVPILLAGAHTRPPPPLDSLSLARSPPEPLRSIPPRTPRDRHQQALQEP